MKTTLILVGKTNGKLFTQGIDDYAKRIRHYMPFTIKVLPELKSTKSLTEEQQKSKEGEMILKVVSPSDDVVLLDEHGAEYRSIEFASWLEKKRNSGRNIVFLSCVFIEHLPAWRHFANDVAREVWIICIADFCYVFI